MEELTSDYTTCTGIYGNSAGTGTETTPMERRRPPQWSGPQGKDDSGARAWSFLVFGIVLLAEMVYIV